MMRSELVEDFAEAIHQVGQFDPLAGLILQARADQLHQRFRKLLIPVGVWIGETMVDLPLQVVPRARKERHPAGH